MPLFPSIVIPAKAGIHGGSVWIPAFAGMTNKNKREGA
ncbi:hypothetical protein MICA_1276 [Micavibrio aeruginosavorus ARL-13]|uniref:Uncharacterized protein n=1 Tax=Micavibrio aeruginosavorus (strain ARL-13) TaxID=856793 RepID=G2KRN6_MICAA|nr:hypothetical protein MICA_1276 [Micavibrio aeruginosavorus ARL-13]